MSSTIIIGNGIAGITAARHLRKQTNGNITVISGETDYFFSRTALMYIYMGHMRYEHTKPYEDFFWQKNRIELRRAWVLQVVPESKLLHLSDGTSLTYDQLLIASGSKSNFFDWPGQTLQGVQGLYSYQDLESMEDSTHDIDRAVVVGGGLIGVEMAEMLHSRGIPTTVLVREKLWMSHVLPKQEAAMVTRHIQRRGIDLRLGTELVAIEGNEQGRVRQVTTNKGEHIPCQFVGLTVGVRPNIAFLAASGIATNKGVVVDEYLRTNIPDIYAAGDCAELRSTAVNRRPIEPLWYVGRRMGEVVANNLAGGNERYDAGIWFNSAKFFNLEYQVYGDIAARPVEGIESLYYEAPSGTQSIRINYASPHGKVLGFNLMGVRYRHELCEEWLQAGRDIHFVLQNLGAANFDPEFHRQHEHHLIAMYNKMHPEMAVQLERKRGLRSLFAARAAAARLPP